MAFNFSHPQLVTISCDKISNDIYQLNNLISTNIQSKSKGFMVEYYIRPPVQIFIELNRFNLNLMFIRLGLQLREHKSNKIEIYFVNNGQEDDTKMLIARYCCPLNESDFTIVNPFYKPNVSLPSVECNINKSYTISGRNSRYCRNISKIIIKINSTMNSSVPCLSSLDIYGEPNLSKASDIVNFFNLFQTKRMQTVDESTQKQKQNQEAITDFEHLAPSEFYDSITHELMSMPYLLPSGKNVDKTTLDRCRNTANDIQIDPFTRLPFTCDSKPIPNAELKMRIDRFIMTNGKSEIDSLNEFKKRLFQ